MVHAAMADAKIRPEQQIEESDSEPSRTLAVSLRYARTGGVLACLTGGGALLTALLLDQHSLSTLPVALATILGAAGTTVAAVRAAQTLQIGRGLYCKSEATQARERRKAEARTHTLTAHLAGRDTEVVALRADVQLLRAASTRQREETQRRARLLDSAVQATSELMMITEADPAQPRVVFVNEAFERMTGFRPRDILGRVPALLHGPQTDARVVAQMYATLAAGKPFEAELQYCRQDGTTFWAEVTSHPMFDEKGWQTHWVSIQRDITERRHHAAQIQWQADHDSLTGLPNRKRYQEQLTDALALATQENTSVGVLFFDLDRFKQINDTLGHAVGDTLLVEVARRLGRCLGTDDTLARIGGDEFTILLPGLSHHREAASMAQCLLDTLAEPFVADGRELFVTASIGISVAPQDGDNINDLLKNADLAMYRAKDEGRDRYRIYNEAMNDTLLDKLMLENHLRRALEKEEFHLLYQPQVDLLTGAVIGVEALIRWEHPTLGRVSPNDFIPIAEETGLIVAIGAWTREVACRQGAQWFEQGYPLRVSVNLCAREFSQPDLADQVAAVLERTGLPPHLLDIELTERTLVRDGVASETLHDLHHLGVRLSVDDFGTGYSSLSYLRTLPLDVMKIDKSFINGLGSGDSKSDAVVHALIELARGIELEVIAEGVETDAQRTALIALGCDIIQGYLFSRPLPAHAVADLVRQTAPAPEGATTALALVG